MKSPLNITLQDIRSRFVDSERDQPENDEQSADTSSQSPDGDRSSFDWNRRDRSQQSLKEPAVIREILVDVTDYFHTSSDELPFDNTPANQFLETQWFDIQSVDPDSVIEHYWINKPFTHVIITQDEKTESLQYHLLEPKLSEFEQHVKDHLKETIIEQARISGSKSNTDDLQLRSSIESTIAERTPMLAPGQRQKLFYYIHRRLLGHWKLGPLLNDNKLEEISCSGSGTPVYVYHRDHADIQTTIQLESKEIELIVRRLAQETGQSISVARPKVSGVLQGDHRVHLTLDSGIAPQGSNFSIRNFEDVQYTPIDLLNFGTFSVQQLALFWLCIEHHASIMFCGPTASGKTTSLNASSVFFPPDVKIVSIEKIGEIRLSRGNWTQYVIRDAGSQGDSVEVTMNDLLQSALHERPEYIIVGEIRTEQAVAQTFLSSIFTGHPGATTFHASSAQEAIDRLITRPINLPDRMPAALDIISVQRQVDIGTEKRRNARRCVQLAEPRWEDGLDIVPISTWDPTTDSHDILTDNFIRMPMFKKLKDLRGWDIGRSLTELAVREKVLLWMADNDITNLDRISSIVDQYYRNRDQVLDRIYKPTDADEPPEWTKTADLSTLDTADSGLMTRTPTEQLLRSEKSELNPDTFSTTKDDASDGFEVESDG